MMYTLARDKSNLDEGVRPQGSPCQCRDEVCDQSLAMLLSSDCACTSVVE